MKRHYLRLLPVGAAILLLIGCSTPPSSAHAPTPKATVDPTTQAYINVLQTYYVPWITEYASNRQCSYDFLRLPAAQQTVQQVAACRPIVVTDATAEKALISQLEKAQPPAQWQGAHAALRQAVQGADTYDGQRLQAINAQSVSQFVTVVTNAPVVFDAFCGPISTFNLWFAAHGVSSLPQPAPNCS